jgi:8-oxo-dGTP pyrophosphatase MutT (NUDIX family)
VTQSEFQQRCPSLLDDGLRARIARHLSGRARLCAPLAQQRPAAVAVVLVPGSRGEPSFLLTRRPSELPRHAGQFALPGGRQEPGETPEEAARRELDEELGVKLGAECVLGLLDDLVTHSGFVITPVVLWGAEVTSLTPDPREVAIAYRVPIAALYRPEVPLLLHGPRAARGQAAVEAGGSARESKGDAAPAAPLLALPLLGTHIFSPSAAIIYQLREVVLEGRDTPVHQFAQPRFAWK